ncbi:hypothetical protein H4R33_001896 [Dimargaris cristalligena]|nr:hypothetical protein H4R33_001896 [Dimargaris cristalligena]
MPPKIGTLQIYVAEGRNLPNRDFFGKQDPFLEFTLGNISKRTRVDKKGGCNPKWKEDVFLDVPQGVQNLAMKCCDRDVSSNDDIGSSSIDLFRIFEEEEVHSWYKMQRKGKFAGEIYLEFTYTPTTGRKKPSLHKLHGPMASMATLNAVPYAAHSSTTGMVNNPVAPPTGSVRPFASTAPAASRPPYQPPVATSKPPALAPAASMLSLPGSYPSENFSQISLPPDNYSNASMSTLGPYPLPHTNSFSQANLSPTTSYPMHHYSTPGSVAPMAYPPAPGPYGDPNPSSYSHFGPTYCSPPPAQPQYPSSSMGSADFVGGFVAPPLATSPYPPNSSPPLHQGYPPMGPPPTSLPPSGMVNVYPPGFSPNNLPQPTAPPIYDPHQDYTPGGFTFTPY